MGPWSSDINPWTSDMDSWSSDMDPWSSHGSLIKDSAWNNSFQNENKFKILDTVSLISNTKTRST